MLPKPSLCFTIPSIHDHTKLECRVFHPASLNSPSAAAPPWGRHVAVVAHPYAPLGGCYDDPIVDLVAGTLLQLGFMVATFNFRGASGARTSWTSKPEQADYMSVVGFMAYYAHYIDFPHRISAESSSSPIMLQAGYSYGAMITTKLPPLHDIIALFESPAVHTDAADIRLRAQHLAEQQNRLSSGPASPRRSMGMRVGGDEDVSRKSHDIPASHSLTDREDIIRKGVKDLLLRTKRVHKKHRHKPHEQAEEVIHEEECMAKVEDLRHFRSAYLVVSPPVGFMTNLATMSFSGLFNGSVKKGGRNGHGTAHHDGAGDSGLDTAELKFARNHTLAIYGTQDGFVTQRKIREWTSRLKSIDSTMFHDVEVAGAGHFWAEEGTVYQLRDAIGAFGTDLLGTKAHMLRPWDGT
ncbi:hypothetical protein AB5N19_13941 [Seiridium cardinale]